MLTFFHFLTSPFFENARYRLVNDTGNFLLCNKKQGAYTPCFLLNNILHAGVLILLRHGAKLGEAASA